VIGDREAEVSLSLVDDVRMEFLNRQYRGIAGTTDVLSFSMLEDDGEENALLPPGQVPAPEAEVLLGDIVISVPKALSQADAYGNSFKAEMVFLAVHGMLHLLGYDDETEPDAARMMEIARQVMDKLGLEAGRDA
jgi:probable rRNA maturation factor